MSGPNAEQGVETNLHREQSRHHRGDARLPPRVQRLLLARWLIGREGSVAAAEGALEGEKAAEADVVAVAGRRVAG